MKLRSTLLVFGALCVWSGRSCEVVEGSEASIVDSATDVLTEFMQLPQDGIPRALLARAEGIVVVPSTIKVGLIAGVRHGRGVAVVRDEQGQWQAPVLLTMTGGSAGWQAGIQSTDVILVFQTRKGVQGLLRGKFTIGVDAAAAVGPVGRQAAAATDGRLQAEILSYSRSRGLFVGASVDGTLLQIDHGANQRYYGAGQATSSGAAPAFPVSASRLLSTLATFSGDLVASDTGAPVTSPTGPAVQPPVRLGDVPAADATRGVSSEPIDPLEATRLELATAAEQLGSLLDDAWRRYLALPSVVFSGEGLPTPESLEQSLRRFGRVARDSRYQLLLDRTEFQEVHGLLKTYSQQVNALSATDGPAR